jgi:hypothetical protein
MYLEACAASGGTRRVSTVRRSAGSWSTLDPHDVAAGACFRTKARSAGTYNTDPVRSGNRPVKRRSLWLCVITTFLSACSGSGEGLDESGRPIEAPQEPLIAELASIQRHVFTPVCTVCHAGAAAPLGLRLEEGAAYAMLVNAPSVEEPSLNRVEPGDPDASYLIRKLEGTAGGTRMPLNAPPLPPGTIAVIRQWILDGALPESAAASATGDAATLQSVWPVANADFAAPPWEIVLSASAHLDTNLLAAGAISLYRSAADPGEPAGQALEISIAVRSLEPTVFAVIVPEQARLPGIYRLRVSGTAPLALADLRGRPIDGDGDGRPGGDFTLEFAVEELR